MKISSIIKDIADYLTNKDVLVNRKVNEKYYIEVQNIILFLILNTEYETEITTEHSHLTNVCPKLSKCLLANIITDLCLSDLFTVTIRKFPIDITQELLQEMLPCIKYTSTENKLESSYAYVREVILRLNETNFTSIKVIFFI